MPNLNIGIWDTIAFAHMAIQLKYLRSELISEGNFEILKDHIDYR